MIKTQRVKPCIPIPAIDAFIDEEQMGKKEENKERNRERISSPATLDPSVASYDPQESCSESILVIPIDYKRKIYIFNPHRLEINELIHHMIPVSHRSQSNDPG